MPPIITLLSDFGHQDAYVGVLKGVMLQINPHLQFVDLTHAIPAQDIASGGWQLAQACAYFPSDTVHFAVVDPGVGSTRRGIAVQTSVGWFVGPDNGLFSQVWGQFPPLAAVALTQSQYWRTPHPSHTFHGRDIFAPVAAHLASGLALTQLGPSLEIAELVRLPLPSYHPIPGGWQGHIQAVDGFGNLITNLPEALISGGNGPLVWHLEIAGQQILGGSTYSHAAWGSLVALVGSHGWLEIAVNGGNAQQTLGQRVGDPVSLSVAAV